MITNLYCILDKVAHDILGGIIRASNDEVARRAFHDALKNENSPMKGHEEDYLMLRVGSIDQTNGCLQNYGGGDAHIPQPIASGADWINANKDGIK